MRPLTALLAMSVRRGLPLRRTAVLAVIQLAPVSIYLLATTNRTADSAFDGLVGVATGILFALTVPVVSIVVGSSALGTERRDQTLSFIVLRPIPRSAIAATRTLAAVVAAVALNVFGAVVLGLAHVARFGSVEVLVGLVVGVAVSTVIYVAVTVPLGFLTDRSVIIAMAYLLVFENGVVNALPGLTTLSPWRTGLAVFGVVSPEAAPRVLDTIGTTDLSGSGSFVTMVAVLAVGVFLTAQLLRSRDLA